MITNERAIPVINLLNREKNGVLSTLSKKMGGWPFGSLTPFAMTAEGDPMFLLSGLAEHTHNIVADPRVSLFLQDSSALDNPQAGARATILGNAGMIEDASLDDAKNRYLDRFPDSAQMFQMGDFKLFRLKIERVRFIGGFGEMYWLSWEE